jgi:small subunit ribosomal protein S27e
MARIKVIPKPESNFLKVKCSKCSNEQTIFERCSTIVRCNVCEEVLAEPTGGKASIKAEVLQVLT